MAATWYDTMRRLARVGIPLQARFTFSHPERVPQTGGVLLVSNHLGPTDPIFVGVRLGREMRILARSEIFEWPLLGWLARRCGAVPIHRREADREALRIALGLLVKEQCVLVFPEGNYARAPAPPGMLPLRTGAAWLALRAGVPVVPVAITGSERVWTLPRGWRVWHHPHVHVVFGEPYRPGVPAGLSTREAMRRAADEMAQRIAALLPEAYRGRYRTGSGSSTGTGDSTGHDETPLPAGALPSPTP